MVEELSTRKDPTMTSLFETPVDYEVAFRNFWKITTDLPNVGIAVGDVEGNILFANRTFRKIFYHNPDFDPQGFGIEDLEGREVAEERVRIIRKVCESGEPIMLTHTRLGVRVQSVIYPWKPYDYGGAARHMVTFSRSSATDEFSSGDVDIFESEFNSWGPLDELTDRQLEVLAALRDGLSQKEAAHLLGVTPKTIETHRDQVIRRLGLSSTLEAIRLADRAGLTIENAKVRRHKELPWKRMAESRGFVPTSHGVA